MLNVSGRPNGRAHVGFRTAICRQANISDFGVILIPISDLSTIWARAERERPVCSIASKTCWLLLLDSHIDEW